jgi:integral membrane protein (TIGR01906 family)
MKAKLISVPMSVALIAVVLLTTVQFAVSDLSFFGDEYLKYGNAAELGMEDAELLRVTGELLDYIRGDRPELDMTASIKGKMTEVFNEREKTHMVDVRALYLNAMRVRNVLAVVFLLGAAALVRRRESLRVWSGGYLLALALIGVTLLALGVLIARDFTYFWTNFHHVFFTNDLWLLDPATDRMIVMFPEGFFFDLVGRILVITVSILGGLGVIALVTRCLGRRPLN